MVDNSREPLSSPKLPNESDRFGSYLLESLQDEDKSGRLFKATDSNTGRTASLKILSPELTRNPAFIDVLRIQMQSAVSLNEPGIVPIYEIGQQDGLCFLSTEWPGTGLLSQQIVANGKFALWEALDIIIKSAEALHSASETRLFHGNLRLHSIAIYPGGSIKISELGFVAAVRAMYGGVNLPVYLGAARFLAPEITTNGAVDYRADIYSLGLILYFLLFSVTPFRYEGEKLMGAEETIEQEYMDDVLKIISKMTENNPDRRYRDYHSTLKDLRSLYAKCSPAIHVPTLKNISGPVIKNQKFFKLLCAVYASSSVGCVTVSEKEIRRSLYIRKSEVVSFESNKPEESIWEWLIERKEIDPKNRPADQESIQRTLTKMISNGLIRLEDFRFRYQEFVNRLLSDLLKKSSADAEFISGEIDGEPLCSIRLGALLLKAARYSIDFDDVLAEIKSDSFLNRTGLFDQLVTGLQFTDEETLLVQVSKDGIFTGALRVTAGSSAEKGLRFLYFLKMIGALELKAASEASAGPPPLPYAAPVEKAVSEEFELNEEQQDESLKSDGVRMEIQRTATKMDRDRLDQEAERRYEMAKEFYRNEKYWEASNYCEQALGLHEDGKYYWLMGLSYAHHPRFRHKAEDSFHRALRLDPLNDELHADLADFYLAQGLYLRSRTHCLKALEIIPDQTRAREILQDPVFAKLGPGGCCCEHDPGCNHEEHKAWRRK